MIKKIIISTLLVTIFLFFSFLQYQKISSLQESKTDMESRIEELESTKADLESKIDDLESRIDNIEYR